MATLTLLNPLPQRGNRSAILAGNQLVPIVHNTMYEALHNVSSLLVHEAAWHWGEIQ